MSRYTWRIQSPRINPIKSRFFNKKRHIVKLHFWTPISIVKANKINNNQKYRVKCIKSIKLSFEQEFQQLQKFWKRKKWKIFEGSLYPTTHVGLALLSMSKNGEGNSSNGGRGDGGGSLAEALDGGRVEQRRWQVTLLFPFKYNYKTWNN